MNLKGKNFLKLLDFTSQDMEDLLNLAAELKAKKKTGKLNPNIAKYCLKEPMLEMEEAHES